MLADILHKIASQWQTEEHDYYPRPSMAGPERCTRQMVYHGLKIPKEPLGGRTLFVFDDGKWHEELTLDWIRKSSYQVHSEQMEIKVDMGFDFKLKGHIDGIVTDLLGVDYLLEHKSINHFSWQKYWDGAIPYDYVAQCCLYLRGLQVDNPNLLQAILLLKNKNTAAYMEFILEYNRNSDTALIATATNSNGEVKVVNEEIPDAVQASFQKFHYVNECIQKQTLPKRDYFIGDDWHCEYCAWCKTCWAGYKKEFAELKTDTMLPDDVADMLRYYKELGGQKSDIEKEYKELSGKIKDTMKQIGAREGRAGEFIAKLSLSEVNRIDKEKLTPAEIARATTTSMSERLYVSTPKVKGEKQ